MEEHGSMCSLGQVLYKEVLFGSTTIVVNHGCIKKYMELQNKWKHTNLKQFGPTHLIELISKQGIVSFKSTNFSVCLYSYLNVFVVEVKPNQEATNNSNQYNLLSIIQSSTTDSEADHLRKFAVSPLWTLSKLNAMWGVQVLSTD